MIDKNGKSSLPSDATDCDMQALAVRTISMAIREVVVAGHDSSRRPPNSFSRTHSSRSLVSPPLAQEQVLYE